MKSDVPEPDPLLAAARKAKSRLQDALAGHAGVVGIGITRRDGRHQITVRTTPSTPPGDLPSEIDGIVVEVLVQGEVQAQG